MAHDLKRVEQWLNRRDLFPNTASPNRCIVQGRENDIRHALISLLFEIGLETDLIYMALWSVKGSDQKQNDLSQPGEFILSRMQIGD